MTATEDIIKQYTDYEVVKEALEKKKHNKPLTIRLAHALYEKDFRHSPYENAKYPGRFPAKEAEWLSEKLKYAVKAVK